MRNSAKNADQVKKSFNTYLSDPPASMSGKLPMFPCFLRQKEMATLMRFFTYFRAREKNDSETNFEIDRKSLPILRKWPNFISRLLTDLHSLSVISRSSTVMPLKQRCFRFSQSKFPYSPAAIFAFVILFNLCSHEKISGKKSQVGT